MTFESLQLSTPLLKALTEEGYSQPTPIQEQAIPLILQGRDVLGCAQTGTGKTAAFALPILQRLDPGVNAPKKRLIKGLIVTPTRELAIQIDESFKAYGRHVNVRHAVIFGGVGQQPQVDALKRGVDVLVATPGRLLDLMGQGYISLKDLELFVLDEADRMLDMGFIHDVKRIIAVLPAQRQSLFFSATMPPSIVKLAGTILTKPAQVTVTPVSSTVDTIDQLLIYVEKIDKGALLVDLIERNKLESVLVFTRTKHGRTKSPRRWEKSRYVPRPFTAISRKTPDNAHLPSLKTVRFKCWLPPTSLPEASMWTTWPAWSTLKYPMSPRPTCTASAARAGQGLPVKRFPFARRQKNPTLGTLKN